MKKHVNYLALITLFASLMLLFASCESETIEPTEEEPVNEPIVYTLSGTAQQADYENTLQGSLTINPDNSFEIATYLGNMEGTISNNKTSSALSIESTSGYFEEYTNMNGSVDLEENKLNINGESANGDPIYLISDLLEDDTGRWTDEVSKSTLWFTHYEDETVNITIGNKTLGPIQKHFSEIGNEPDENGLLLIWARDMDLWESKVQTVEGTLEGLDGNPVQFAHNVHAQFVLDKEQEYTYIAEWSDGTYYEGTVSTTIGGLVKPIHIKKICACPVGELEIVENTLKVNGVSTGVSCCDVMAYNFVTGVSNSGFTFGEGAVFNQDTAYRISLFGSNLNGGNANILFYEGQEITSFTQSGGFEVDVDAAHEIGDWDASNTDVNQGSISVSKLVEENGEVVSFTLQFNDVICSAWDNSSKIVSGKISASVKE